MSWVLFILGAFVLSGGIKTQPVFGMTPDEAGMALGCSLWLLAFVAWVVDRFTDRGPS